MFPLDSSTNYCTYSHGPQSQVRHKDQMTTKRWNYYLFPEKNLCYKVAIPILYKLSFIVSPTCAFRHFLIPPWKTPYHLKTSLLSQPSALCFSLSHTLLLLWLPMVHDAKEVILNCGFIVLNFLFLMQPFSLPHRANPKAVEINAVTPRPDFDSLAHSPNPHICQCFLEIFTFSLNWSELGVILPVL